MPRMTDSMLPRLRSDTSGLGPVIVPGRLWGDLVLDEDGVAVTAGDLRSWELTAEEAWRMALRNLASRSSPSRWQAVETVPGMSIYLPGGGDASARVLLLPHLLDVPPEGVLVGLPAREHLIVVPLDDFAHLPAIRVLATASQLAHAQSSESLTDQLFWFDGARLVHVPVTHDGESVEVLPPPELHAAVERLGRRMVVKLVAEA